MEALQLGDLALLLRLLQLRLRGGCQYQRKLSREQRLQHRRRQHGPAKLMDEVDW